MMPNTKHLPPSPPASENVQTGPESRGQGISVVVTPAAVFRDSRALKQASSLDRFGFSSFILEGQRSTSSPDLAGIRVLSVGGNGGPSVLNLGQKKTGIRLWLRNRVTSPNASWVEAWIGFCAYLIYYFWHFLIGGLRRVPPASLYYLNEFSFFPALWLKRWLYGSAIAYDARDFYIGIETGATKTPFQKLVVGFGRKIERKCIRHAQIFTTVSEGIANLFEAEFGRRPDVIYNAHDDRIDHVPNRSLRDRLSLTEGSCVVVIVGQAKPGQEFSGVLGALRRLPALNVACIGNGYRELFSKMHLCREITGRIHFVENLPATEVVPLIRDADASLIVYYERSENYRNALPNGFFQSVAAELPVLHGGLFEMSRICRDLEFGFSVAPDDVDGMTAAIQMVIEKADWYADQKTRSQRAARELAWQNQEAKLTALLSSTLERGSR